MVGSHFRRDIQGLRGIAVLIVVLYHAETFVVGGYVGVDVFFVISGFVIAGVLLRELESQGSVDLRRFYSRRVRRLLPALGAMIVGVGLLSILILSPAYQLPAALKTGAAGAGSSANLYLWFFGGGYFTPTDEGNPFVHTWSLGVEEQFYLIFPAVVAASWALGKRRNGNPATTLRFVLLVVVISSLALSLIFSYDIAGVQSRLPAGQRFAFYGPFSRAWEFAVGVLLAMFMGARQSMGRPLLGWLGLSLLAATSLWLGLPASFPGVAAVLPVGAAILLMLNASTGVRRILTLSPLVWIGDRSYGWYLWHWPFVVFSKLLFPGNSLAPMAAVIVALAPTVASYRWVETRFRAKPGMAPRGAVRLALVTSGVPLILLLAGVSAANAGLGLPANMERGEQSALALCNESDNPFRGDCTSEPEGPVTGTIMLVGDSHAGVISTAVVEASQTTGQRVIMRTFAGCPFIVADAQFGKHCVDRNDSLFSLVAEVKPDILIIANRSVVYPPGLPNNVFAGPEGNSNVDVLASEDELQRWEEAFGGAIRMVEEHTQKVIVVSVVPHFEAVDYDPSLPSLLNRDGIDMSRSVEEIQRVRLPVLLAEERALAQSTIPTVVLDSLTILCDDVCRVRDSDGRFLWGDPSHLTPLGSRLLVESLELQLSSQ